MRIRIPEYLTKPKIPQLQYPVMEQNIVWFDVAMHNVVFLEDSEGLEELFEEQEGLGLGESALAFEHFLEGATIAEFIHEVEVVCCAQHLFEAHDMGAGGDVG